MAALARILKVNFLTPGRAGTKYVAWNGNRFDAYFIAAALLLEDEYTLKPYLTRSKSLRGLRVIQRFDHDGNELDPQHAPAWEFLDGIAMLGLAGVKLEKLLLNFAPDHAKLTGVIDFEKEEFNPANPKHREYAYRDSVGLYHAMMRAQSIMLNTFNEPLAVTMGGVCIKIFAAHIPRDVTIQAPTFMVEDLIRRFLLRGGFCFHVRKYSGPIWKYDINQAYAAAMREAALPCGDLLHSRTGEPPRDAPFMVRMKASKPGNKIPFYYRTDEGGALKTKFSGESIAETWITSIEYWQLRDEGWSIRVFEWYEWAGSFNMREYVDKLEVLRSNAEGGPSGPMGTMVKATGNHSYGKTLEALEPIEYVIARECPDDALPFYDNGFEPLDFVFYRIGEDRQRKAHHQPQIGAFITAHVRMVLRRVALLNPDAWLYADTDCVVFSEDMTAHIDIDSKRYGAWKIEESGTPFLMIAKKVYAEIGGSKRSAKGMHVSKLTAEDFAAWFEGDEPMQTQVQINNFLSVLVGAEMYREQVRSGTAVEGSKNRSKAPKKSQSIA